MPNASSPLPDADHDAAFYSGVPAKRALAWLVDVVLTALLTAIIVPFTAFTALFFLPFLFLVVNGLYRWTSIARFSATPGMRLAAIEFRRFDGQRFDAGTAFLHTAAYLVSTAMVLPQLVSIAFMLLSSRGQGLTDMLIGSVALHRPSRF